MTAAMFQTIQDTLAEQKREPLTIDDVTNMIAGQIGQHAPIGFYPKSFAAVVLVSYPLKKWRFILMSLLPLLLGIVPIVVFWFSPVEWKVWNGFWFGFAIMGLISPYPDYYNVHQVLKQAPPKCHIQNYGNDTYWIE